MKHLPLLMYTTFCGLYSMQTEAADKKGERPNILWLTFEDTSAYEFGCYGNKGVHTPNADSLAARGIQFMNAWSVAPQSSAARSSLITGCYSSTYGMDIHPVPYDTPADIFFPQRLREAGYYCTNNSKTHYNSTTDNKSCWDECNNKASYNSPKRRKDQPFFAVFNTVTSHMGRIRTFHTDGRRDYTQEGIYPALLSLPSYVPDLPEVRSDYAGHLEAVQDVDTWLGFFMKDLKEKGLDDNTLVVYTSDQGFYMGEHGWFDKRFMYEESMRTPLIMRLPKDFRAKGDIDEMVQNIDYAPTFLELAGVEVPEDIQGISLVLLLKGEKPADWRKALYYHFYEYPAEHMVKRHYGVRTDRYKLIHFYNDIDEWELYDLQADPTEMRNIYGQPGTEEIIKDLKAQLTALQEQYNDPVRFSPERDKE